MECHVMKRDNSWINEVKKVLKPVDHVPNRYGDRFIPRRYAQTSSSRFKAECKSDRGTDVMRMERKGYWRSHSFATVFNQMFNLSPVADKILNFSDATNQEICQRLAIREPLLLQREPMYKNEHKLDWGCRPRSKPLAFIESVHDLPRIKVEYTNIIDWSSKNQIAAIFSKRLVVWTPNSDVTFAYCALYTTAIAFNPAGDALAMASFTLSRPILRLLSCLRPFVKANVRHVKVFPHIDTDISCLAWHSSGRYLACGLGNGKIMIIRTRDFEIMPGASSRVHYYRIIMVKFSATSKYLASTDESGRLYIWSWNANCELLPLTAWVSNDGMASIFDWHPWREEEIIIADTEPVTIAVYHVARRQVLSFHRRRNVDCLITALAFNKISGELVVSYAYPSRTGKAPDMLVLASMDRVVDAMENHDDQVAHLFWSPDGKQLASAGCDEMLTIWNFFGTSPTGQQKGASSTQPQYRKRNKEPMDGFDYTFLFKPMR